MPVNPYFNQTSYTQEQNLVDTLLQESIQIHGQNFYYIKKTKVDEDTIFNEDTLSRYEDATLIEMYIEDAEGFGGEGDFLSKFGLEVRDQLNVLVSKTRWEEEHPTYLTPKEGDLLYWPLVDKIFEIQFIEDEVNFYQLGKTYAYRLQTETFEYSHEDFDTGITEIDDVETERQYSVDLTMGTGTGEFQVGEIVYQGASFETAAASGAVLSWNNGTKVLRLNNLTGSFNQNTNTIGVTSGANYLLGATQQYVYVEDKTLDNNEFRADGDEVVDFSVTNPFSEGY